MFAYGSLIWKPACEFVEIRTGLLRGWHRAFCLGWNTRWRGSVENPGLMLALDRGGVCKGVLYRLPPDAVEANLELLCRREMGFKPSPFPPRWVQVAHRDRRHGAAPSPSCIDRNSAAAMSAGWTKPTVADVLARARSDHAARWRSTCSTRSGISRRWVSTTAICGGCRNWSPTGSTPRPNL